MIVVSVDPINLTTGTHLGSRKLQKKFDKTINVKILNPLCIICEDTMHNIPSKVSIFAYTNKWRNNIVQK